MTTTLTAYVLAAILGWTRPHATPRDAADAAWLSGIASDIAEVSQQEEPLFADDVSHARTAILLASVARFESSFAPWVDAGLCNDKTWRDGNLAVHHGSTCDGGHAFSLWQIHPYAGPSGEAMIGDRRVAIREAIARMRVSLATRGDLCWYTGEPASGECPKAELRLRTAIVWEKSHPFTRAQGVD
jgi:hypothetical protein